MADISQLNSRFGTSDDLKALSAELHKRGMYLMVDVVVNDVMSTSITPDLSGYLFNAGTPYCNASTPLGVPVPRGRRSAGVTPGSDPRRTHSRVMVERTSVFDERATLRGAAQKARASAAGRSAFARRLTRCVHQMREGVRPFTREHARQRGVRPGLRRGLSRRKAREPCSGRSGPRTSYLFGGAACAARRSRTSPRGGGVGRTRARGRHLSWRSRNDALAVGARASSCLQKSAERLRAQRSAQSVPIGSKARTGRRGT